MWACTKRPEPCVIEHEKVHQKQWHSLDLLFLELMKIVFWFNPLLYFYQKRLVEAHEFEADKQTYPKFQNSYYQTLINQVLDTESYLTVNYWFRPKLIKLRLQMLEKKEKSNKGMTKYLLTIPVLAMSSLMLSAEMTQNISDEKTSTIAVTNVKTEQQEPTEVMPFMAVEKKPRFKSCADVAESEAQQCFKEEIDKHIVQHFRYPPEALQQGIQGRVNVVFTIDIQGNITNINADGKDKLLEDEATRIIQMLPQLIPAQHKGKNVPVTFLYPVVFKLSK